jgi:hypothetical protein
LPAPSRWDEIRIAHNAAVVAGDEPLRARLFARLVDSLDRNAHCTEPGGTQRLGIRLDSTVSDELSVYFLAAGPQPPLSEFVVTGVEERAPRWSWLRADPESRVVGMPFGAPPMTWRAGFVYASTSEILARPGTERLVGRWEGPIDADRGDCSESRSLTVLSVH